MAKNEAWIDKTETERVRVSISEFNDTQYIDVRACYQAEDGEWRPTKRGVTLPLDQLEEFKEAVNQLAAD